MGYKYLSKDSLKMQGGLMCEGGILVGHYGMTSQTEVPTTATLSFYS